MSDGGVVGRSVGASASRVRQWLQNCAPGRLGCWQFGQMTGIMGHTAAAYTYRFKASANLDYLDLDPTNTTRHHVVDQRADRSRYTGNQRNQQRHQHVQHQGEQDTSDATAYGKIKETE